MEEPLKNLKTKCSRLTPLNVIFIFAVFILLIGIVIETMKLLILIGAFLIAVYILFWSGWIIRWFKNN